MALSHLGESGAIESFEEQTPQGRQVRLWYDFSRVSTLESYNWSFARKRRILAEHSDDPPDGIWQYRYQYPDDCVKARWIENPLGPDADKVPFSVEQSEDGFSKTILTDMEDAKLIYTKNVESPSLFTMHFAQTLSLNLGAHMAVALTGKRSLKEGLMEEWYRSVILSQGYDANEEIQKAPREAEVIRGRR
jgi:hypothetical protein